MLTATIGSQSQAHETKSRGGFLGALLKKLHVPIDPDPQESFERSEVSGQVQVGEPPADGSPDFGKAPVAELGNVAGGPVEVSGPTEISTGPPRLLAWNGTIYDSGSESEYQRYDSGLLHENRESGWRESSLQLQIGFGLPSQERSHKAHGSSYDRHRWGLVSEKHDRGSESGHQDHQGLGLWGI